MSNSFKKNISLSRYICLSTCKCTSSHYRKLC